jgi:predicted RNase H-like HicB family nuclease
VLRPKKKPAKKQARKRAITSRYTAYFIPDEEAGGYTAHIPALGLVTEGETLEEARDMAKDAIEGRIAALRHLGQPIPKDIKPERLEVKL